LLVLPISLGYAADRSHEAATVAKLIILGRSSPAAFDAQWSFDYFFCLKGALRHVRSEVQLSRSIQISFMNLEY
jgi:hypothetical protein